MKIMEIKQKSTPTKLITFLIDINFDTSEYNNGIYKYKLIKRVWICSTNLIYELYKYDVENIAFP